MDATHAVGGRNTCLANGLDLSIVRYEQICCAAWVEPAHLRRTDPVPICVDLSRLNAVPLPFFVRGWGLLDLRRV